MSSRRLLRANLARLLAGLAIFVNTIALAADIEVVTCDRDLVQVDAKDAEVQAIVEAIAAACDLRFISHAAIDGRTTLATAEISLSDALERLLGDDSYQLLLADGADPGLRGTLWVFADGQSLPPEARLLFETTLLEGTFSQRRQAVRDLRHHESVDAVELLGLALVDPDERVRDAAMEALAAIGTGPAVAALASMSSSPSAPDRAEAAELLAATDSPAAAGYLVVALKDADPAVRATVIESLADLPGERGLSWIRSALEDPSVEVRKTALETLESLDDERQYRVLYPGN